jgi:uncharacterized membrane protein
LKSVRKFKKIQLKLVSEKIYDKSELTKIRFVIKEGLEMILINIPYIKFGMLSTILVLCTIMLSTIDAGQIPVFAQNSTSTLNNPPITPASEPSDDDDGSSSSNDNNNENDVSNDESAGLSGSDDDGSDNESDSQERSSSDDSDSQETSSNEEDETGDDSEQTNPLLGQIRDRVNGALSASGMLGPVF